MKRGLKRKMNVMLGAVLLILCLAASVSAQDLPDVHFFAVNGGPFYVVNEDLKMFLSVSNFKEGENLEFRDLHTDLLGGKDYVGADGKYYVIYDTYYKRTTNLQTNAEPANYSLHSKFQGGKHYFSVGEYFYMITADGKKYRKTTNMNKAENFKEYTITPACQNGDYYFALDGGFYFAKINEGKYHKVDNFNEGKNHREYTIAKEVMDFVKKRPATRPLDVAHVHFLANDDGPYYVVNEDLGLFLSVTNFHKAENLKVYDLHEQTKGGRGYVATDGRYYIIYDTYYRRTTNLHTNANPAEYSLHPEFQGGKHYFAVGEYFYMITSDGKNYRRTKNMNTAEEFNEFPLSPECQKGDYYFAVTDAYYFADINNSFYHKVDNFNKNTNHRQYPLNPEILEFVTQKPQVISENLIPFNIVDLPTEKKTDLARRRTDYSYTFFPDSDDQMILAVYTSTKNSGGYQIRVLKVEEKNGLVDVYVKETSPQPNQIVTQQINLPSTIVKLQTKNPKITVKDVTGRNYYYFATTSNNSSSWEIELAKKYAPQLRFHPAENSYPSPVEGVINRAYKVRRLPEDFTKLTTGVLPELAINDQGTILEIHRTTDRYMNGSGLSTNYSYEIHYRVGVLNADGSIKFSNHRKLTTGINPSIAINNQNYVVQAHRHSSNDGIDLRYGKLNESTQTVNFKAMYNRTTGENPSVALNDSNIFVMVNQKGDQLEYHFGRLEGEGITFYRAKESIPYKGSHPSVDLNNLGQVVLTYEHDDKIYYQIGQVLENHKLIDFSEPIYLTKGNHSSIELNDAGYVMEIHETSGKHFRKNPNDDVGLYTMLHYRYGKLQMNHGLGNPTIEFSQYIELCSGETPEIVLNNQGDVVEIHETSSLINSDLHYRVLKGNANPLTITSLKDLPANEGGRILVQKGEQSWEAPMMMGSRNLKTYVVISKVGDNIELEYNFFYPDNGSNILGAELLKHFGDWEKIYVTVNSKGDVINYRYNHHAESTTFSKSDITLVGGTHPVVYAALETHASYPSNEILGVFKTGDQVSNNGLIWNSYENDNLEVVKIYGNIINNNNWIHWKGRWGSTLNSPDSKLWK